MTRLLVVFVVLFYFFVAPAYAGQALPGPYSATVLEIIDGDTIRARVRIWLGQEIETLVRISGIDTPEIKSRCETERKMALQAKAQLSELIGGENISLYNIKFGKYAGRVLADIKSLSGRDIANSLLSSHLVQKYDGRKRQSWC